MYALEQPPVRRQVSLLDGTPWGAIAALALVVAVVVVLSLLGLVPRATVGVVGTAAAHGTLLGVALAWTSVGERRDRHAVLEAAAMVALAAGAAATLPGGWALYLTLPVWLACRRPKWIGTAGAPGAGTLLGSAVFGLGLGVHLLVSAGLSARTGRSVCATSPASTSSSTMTTGS